MKEDTGMALLKAVSRWVKANGGSALCTGGISIAQDPETKHRYEVRITVTGTLPKKRPEKSSIGMMSGKKRSLQKGNSDGTS